MPRTRSLRDAFKRPGTGRLCVQSGGRGVVEDCVFCRIVRGQLDAHFVYVGGRVVVFLDKYPVTRGHALVVPKDHYRDVFDAPGDVLSEMVFVAKVVALAQREALGARGVRLVMNSGREAGQEIFHAHMHVIPYGTERMDRRPLTRAEGEAVAEALRKALERLLGASR
ncbi:HIT family protein [Thermofilum pendens]|uniref:HIT family protein n=1 Tax=Thermofilum pendens TaxID=2269 RepID=UPI00069CA363|nr:HIT family protein [Thermofilum pendens]